MAESIKSSTFTLILFAASALAALTLTGCSDTSDTASPTNKSAMADEPTASCVVASAEQANRLLTGLFPGAKVLSNEPYPISASTCLLEVELLADKDRPDTKGFVYVFPDGKSFLNGPLMDKRSQVSLTGGNNQVEKAIADYQATVARAMAKMQPTAPTSSSQEEEEPQAPAQKQTGLPEQTGAEMRREFLAVIKSLPAITEGAGNDPVVYALFDPQCPHCSTLFKQHKTVEQQYGVRFVWIPIFLNDKSWAMSAHLLKVYKQSNEQGLALMKSMLEKTWALSQTDLSSLTEADFDYAKLATIAFYEASKKSDNHRLGTPLVVFENKASEVEVISGVPSEIDWISL